MDGGTIMHNSDDAPDRRKLRGQSPAPSEPSCALAINSGSMTAAVFGSKNARCVFALPDLFCVADYPFAVDGHQSAVMLASRTRAAMASRPSFTKRAKSRGAEPTGTAPN